MSVYMQISSKVAILCLSIDFFTLSEEFFGNRQNVMKVVSSAKVENWHVAEGTLYRFAVIQMAISFDLSSVLISYVLGDTLIKTSSEAKVIRSKWKLKTMFFSRIFWFVQTMSSYHNNTAFYKKLTGKDLGCSSYEDG